MRAENRIHRAVLVAWFAAGVCALLPVGEARAQTSEAEHLSHHPDQAAAAAAAQPGASPASGAMPAAGGAPPMGPPGKSGGMMEGMSEMMKQMGKPPRKELYPSLMELPDLPPEKRAEVAQLAHERMKQGVALLSSGLEKLSGSTAVDDYSGMQEATAQMRQGLAQFESGLAAKRALAEGKVPRNVALQWFKREMSLASPVVGEEARGVLGLSSFHLLTMALLVAFTFAMLALYFFKMRRAAALFGRIEADAGSPPPGSSPPLGGAAGPSAPPGGKAPPSGGSPPPIATPGADSPAPPPADQAPTPAPDEKLLPPASPDKKEKEN